MTGTKLAVPSDVPRHLEILKEAALAAREVARATGTKLVIHEDGVTQLVTPEELDARDAAELTKYRPPLSRCLAAFMPQATKASSPANPIE